MSRTFPACCPRSRTRGTFTGHDLALRQMTVADDPCTALWRRVVAKLRKQRAQLRRKRLFNQLPRAGADQIGQRIGRKSVWIRQGGDGISRHVAYPVLCENGRRVSPAMICRPSGAITNFQLYLPPLWPAQTGRNRGARVRQALRSTGHRAPPDPAEITTNQRHGRALQRAHRRGPAKPPLPLRRRTGDDAAPIRLALQSTTSSISFGQQVPLASHERMAQTQAGTVQETEILPTGM